MKKFILFILFYTLFAGLFIYNSSKVINGERYFLLADDAYISMQYAKNFVLGHGMVWSLNEKVEGFTDPLWALYMIIPHAIGLPLSKTGLFIQITAYIFMVITLLLVWKLSGNMLAPVFTGFFLPLNTWYYSGLEVGLLTLLCTLVVYLITRNAKPLIIYIICGIMLLIRLDMAPFFILVLFFYRKDMAAGAVIMALFTAVHLSFNYFYYGDILPNTYYLKMYKYPLYRLFRGVAWLWINIFAMNWMIFALIFMKKNNDFEKFVMWFLMIETAYTIWIGGDTWEYLGGTNRYLTMVMPVFFVYFINKAKELMRDYALKPVYAATVFVLIFINLNMIKGWKSLKLYVKPADFTESCVETVKAALDIKKNAGLNTVIATHGAGILPYFSEKSYYIDLHGVNDKFLARQGITGVKSLYDIFITAPGHIKYNQDYSIKQLKPDIVVYPILDGKILPYLQEFYDERTKDIWYKKGFD